MAASNAYGDHLLPGDRVCVAAAVEGQAPYSAIVMVARKPGRPNVVQVIYDHSRTSAWVARSRILPPEEVGRVG